MRGARRKVQPVLQNIQIYSGGIIRSDQINVIYTAHLKSNRVAQCAVEISSKKEQKQH